MGKVIKIILSSVSAVVLTLIILPVIVSLLLNLSSVQDFAVKRLARWLGGKMQTEVSVDHLQLRLFNKVALDGVYLKDYHGDTLFYAKRMVVPVRSYGLFGGGVSLGEVELDRVTFNLMQDSTGTTNLKQILQKFKKKEKKKAKNPFRLKADGVAIRDMDFRHLKLERRDKEYGVNFTDLDVSDFNLRVKNVSVVDDSVNLAIDSLRLKEKSGFVIHNLATRSFTISGHGMRFEKLKIEAPDSRFNGNYLYFDYDTWKGYNDFLNDVKISSEFNDSDISFKTIAFFAQSLRTWETRFRDASGVVSGPVSAMTGSLNRVKTRDTEISVRFGLFGLPDVNRTRFTFDVSSLTTNAGDIEYIVQDIARKSLEKNDPLLRKMGEIGFSGNFDGRFSDFVANGLLQTRQGNLGINLNFKPLPARKTGFEGKLRAVNFDAGALFSVPKLGRLTLYAMVSGSFGDGKFNVNTRAQLPDMVYNDYTYHSIDLNGDFENKNFTGAIASKDPNMAFDFDGRLDFNDLLPAYNFDLKLYNADLHKLNFNKRDTVSQVRGRLVAEASGSTLDNINGKATISDLVYVNPVDTVRTGDIRLVAENGTERKLLGMYSSFADVEFKGKLSYNSMFSYFRNTLLSYLPSISDRSRSAPPPASSGTADLNSYYILNMDVKEANNVAGIFLPGLQLAQGTKLSFLFNPESDVFSLMFNSEYIERDNFFVSNLTVNSRNQSDSISLFVRADDLFVSGVYMPNFSVIGGVKENKINLATRFNNKENGTYALLSTTSTLSKNEEKQIPQLTIRFNPSTVTSDRQEWRIWAREIVYDSTQVVFNNFNISSGDQRLTVNGTASRSLQDTLRVQLRNFDLSPLSHITDRQGYHVKGLTNGYADMASALKGGMLYANIAFDSLSVNNVPFRNTVFESKWDFQAAQARFKLFGQERGDQIVNGLYRPTDGRYQVDVRLDNMDLSLLDPVLKGVVKNSQGRARAEFRLTNPNKKMHFNGKLRVDSFRTTVDYTNVTYTLDAADVDMADNVMTMRPTTLHDPQGNAAGFEMSFDFSNFRNLAYDVRIRPESLMVLNTTERDNPLFYGNVYASGNASIRGNKNGVGMDFVATTAGNSHFYMPLNDNASISRADFIVFEDPREKARADSSEVVSRRKQILSRKLSREQAGPSRMNISMQLNVRPNAEMQLVIDPAAGDVLKGRGNGTLNLTINPANDVFTMYGDYDITEGSYKFTLRNIVSRLFTIESGSTIQWTGDPLDAVLNISAVYKLKASLAPLLSSNEQNLRRTTPVDCVIKLTDRLTEPTITFDVKVPNADPETQSLVSHAMNSQEMMATQFLWLLAVKSFYSDNSSTNQSLNIGAQGATVTGIDFLTNQLSSLMSSDRFSFVPKWTPKSEITSDEVGGSFYGELIKDRLILEADVSYDTGNSISMNNRTANTVTGDATLSLILDQAGDFRAQAFTRTIDRFDENQGLQESGIGIFYRENFDNFKDLVKIFKDRFARIGRRKKEKKAAADSTAVALPPEHVHEENE